MARNLTSGRSYLITALSIQLISKQFRKYTNPDFNKKTITKLIIISQKIWKDSLELIFGYGKQEFYPYERYVEIKSKFVIHCDTKVGI